LELVAAILTTEKRKHLKGGVMCSQKFQFLFWVY